MRAFLSGAVIATMIAFPALAAEPGAVPLVTGVVNDHARVVLSGNHAAGTAAAEDRGVIDPAHVFEHVQLQLKRSPAVQAAFDRLVADQQKTGTAEFHRWLSSADLRRYGPAQHDIDRVEAWLQSKGLTVNAVSPSGMTLDISGSAALLAAAFGTELHLYAQGGETHFANTRDVSIPAALVPVVEGVTLSNFFPKPNVVRSPFFTVPTGPGNAPIYAVGPGDFAKIYNVTPMLSGDNPYGHPVVGSAVTIAVLEDSDMQPQDWNRFRTFFQLDSYSAHLLMLHPKGCTAPGPTGDEVEAALDAEWASAAAPDANIVEATCVTTETTFGVATALAGLVEGTQTDATIYSISYGGCEQQNGLPFLMQWSNLAEEAAAEGISIVVSSGDSGASCDRNELARNGLGVNGLAANPYVVSVGGTDFLDTATGTAKDYWSAKNNANDLSSALSYVPEIPWDDSCANSIVAKVIGKSSPIPYCNSASPAGLDGIGATGGASLYFAKPSWQTTALLGMPNDGARDQPDVVSFASNGIWNHASLICFSDHLFGGAPCYYRGVDGSGTPLAVYQMVGGTSVATPAFAGVLALVTQVSGQKLGNPAPRLYQLAQLQFSNPLLVKSCNASLGRDISKGCIFNNVTEGDIAEPCYAGTPDCHINALSTEGIGFLSTENGRNTKPAYSANVGYSLATGLGSVNASNLIYNY